jgi:hypothetical protein
MSLSGMRYYGDDRNHSSLRAIIPEDPPGTGCSLLGICLEDLFPIRPFEGSKFVRVQRGMPLVLSHLAVAFWGPTKLTGMK